MCKFVTSFVTSFMKGDPMSIFSEHLHRLITQANISVSRLSRETGIDRSYIQKFLNGSRIPSSESYVTKICHSLQLTSRQRTEFINSYRIARVGETSYSHFLAVKEFIENIQDINMSHTVSVSLPSGDVPPIPAQPNVEALQGSVNINQAIKLALERECCQEQPEIYLLIQPEHVFLNQLLALLSQTHKNVAIHHFISLDNDSHSSWDNCYNIRILQAILPMIFNHPNYDAQYCYENVASHFNDNTIFPYAIITSQTALLLSYDMRTALLSHDEGIREVYRFKFRKLFDSYEPLYQKVDDYYSYFESMLTPALQCHDKAISFQLEPCFGYMITPDFITEAANIDYATLDKVLLLFEQREKYMSQVSDKLKVTAYFTEKGLKNFLKTGRISECPPELYSPFPESIRYDFVKQLYYGLLGGTLNQEIRLISPSFHIPDNLIISSHDDNHLLLTLIQSAGKYLTLSFNETSIVHAFNDFFEYLPLSPWILSHEETLGVLKKYLPSKTDTIR